MHTHACTHIGMQHIYACTYTQTHAHMPTCAHTHIHTHVCACAHTHTFAQTGSPESSFPLLLASTFHPPLFLIYCACSFPGCGSKIVLTNWLPLLSARLFLGFYFCLSLKVQEHGPEVARERGQIYLYGRDVSAWLEVASTSLGEESRCRGSAVCCFMVLSPTCLSVKASGTQRGHHVFV